MILAVLVLLAHMATEYWSNENWLNESRILSLLVILVATTALRDQLTLAPWLQAVLTELMSIYGGAVANIDDFLSPALWFLLGFLLVANETNLLIRSLFHRFNLSRAFALIRPGWLRNGCQDYSLKRRHRYMDLVITFSVIPGIIASIRTSHTGASSHD